jgi:CubicO group peptidase (beta-lactamase class C family)
MKILLTILITIGCIGCNLKDNCSYQKPIDINDGLQVSTLEKNNLNKAVFDIINQDICTGKYGNIHSLLVIENNKLVIEQYYNGWKRDRLHFLASNTKSVTSFLIGKAIELGKIKDVNQKVLSFFPEYAAREKDTLKQQICVKNLLTMTAGLKWDDETQLYTLQQSDNRLDLALTQPMDTLPGSKYAYSSANSIILSEIIKNTTGQDIAEFARKNLFEPLGIKEFEWSSRNGIYDSYGGLFLKPRDIAKFGLLHLNMGKWKDKTIISEKWIEETLTPYIEINHPLYSCYQWRMAKTDLGFNVWFIPGNGGQIINIIPALNMVIVINADNRNNLNENRLPLGKLMQDIIKIHPVLKQL